MAPVFVEEPEEEEEEEEEPEELGRVEAVRKVEVAEEVIVETWPAASVELGEK